MEGLPKDFTIEENDSFYDNKNSKNSEEILAEINREEMLMFIHVNKLDFGKVEHRIRFIREFEKDAVEYFFEKDFINESIKNFLIDHLEHRSIPSKGFTKYANSEDKNYIANIKFLNIISLPFFNKHVDINFKNIKKFKNKFNKLMKGRIFEEIFLKIIIKLATFKNFTENNKFLNKTSFIFIGEPGCGKSYFAEAFAETLGLPLIKLNFAHNDALTLTGSNSIWRKSDLGMITKEYIKNKYKNPIFLFDEIDKTGNSNGVDIADIISNITDPDQNYIDLFLEIELDFSNIMFFLTANDIKALPPYLLDRCEQYWIPTPSIDEKTDIICDCILPKYLKQNKFLINFRFDKNEIYEIIKKTNMGLRDGKRFVSDVIINYIYQNNIKLNKTNKKLYKISEISKLIDIDNYVKRKSRINKTISFV